MPTKLERRTKSELKYSEIAEDLLQDTFLTYYQKYTQTGIVVIKPLAMLQKIARNKMIDYMRKNGKENDVLPLNEPANENNLQMSMPEMSFADLEEAIQYVLKDTRKKSRDYWIHFYIYKWSINEIAGKFKTTTNNIRITIGKINDRIRYNFLRE